MRAIVEGMDYMLILNPKAGEVEALETQPLSTTLENEGESTDKIVTLEVKENTGTDGIKVTRVPDGATWDATTHVHVMIANKAHELLKRKNRVRSRQGTDPEIDIFNGDPQDQF